MEGRVGSCAPRWGGLLLHWVHTASTKNTCLLVFKQEVCPRPAVLAGDNLWQATV